VTKKLATRTERLLAVLLEFVVFIVPMMPLVLIFGGEAIDPDIVETSIYLNIIIGVWFIAYVVVGILLLSKRGQTIGKHLMNISVFHEKEDKAVGFWYYALMRRAVGEHLVVGLIPLIGLIVYLPYSLIDHLFIFSKDCKTLHDRIAKTKVVKLGHEQQRNGILDFTSI
jgi:uncharacterized RDD family membrane protein YckC